MQLRLHDGKVLNMPVYGNMHGRAIKSVKLNSEDVRRLLTERTPEQLRDFLVHLHTRFAPTEPKEQTK